MNITQVRQSGKLVENQFKALGYNVFPHIEYKCSARLTSALGNCKQQWSCGELVRVVITISQALPIETLNDTMAHEMVHAVAPRGAHHGPQFHRIASQINRTYGYTIQTRATSEENALIGATRVNNGTHCTLLCSNNCGRTHIVSKRSRYARTPQFYKCKCGGSLRVQ